MKGHGDKYLLGAIGGLCLFLLLCLFYRHLFLPPSKPEKYLNYHNFIDTPTGAIRADSSDYSVTDSKIGALHSRFNDLYIFGGVIVTLLLAINVSVYVKTSNEVQSHISENFGKYRDQIILMHAEAEKVLNEIKTKSQLTSLVSNPNTDTEQSTDTNNDNVNN
jgi:hypothetical protein